MTEDEARMGRARAADERFRASLVARLTDMTEAELVHLELTHTLRREAEEQAEAGERRRAREGPFRWAWDRWMEMDRIRRGGA